MIVTLLILPGVGRADEGDDPPVLEPGDTLEVRLTGGGPSLFAFEGSAGNTISVLVRSASPIHDDPLDNPVLTIIRPDGSWLAYNNDHGTERADLRPTDAGIFDLLLDMDGEYRLHADTYGSLYEGDFEVSLWVGDPFRLETFDTDEGVILQGELPRDRAFTFEFEGQAGDMLTVTARDRFSGVDPLLWLMGPEGDVLALNDDHGTQDLTLNVFDARIEAFALPADGLYTIRVTDFLGSAGAFTLEIWRSPV